MAWPTMLSWTKDDRALTGCEALVSEETLRKTPTRGSTIEHRAHVTWTGGPRRGSGALKPDSDAFTSKVRLSSRIEKSLRGETTPEELMAAAHAACFSMTMEGVLTKAGHSVQELETDATVTLERLGDELRVAKSTIVVRGHGASRGLDAETFRELAHVAETCCPVSNAMRDNVVTEVDARLSAPEKVS